MNFILEILHVGWRSKLALKQHKHFHPSGSLEPSKADTIMTDRMLKLTELLQIPLVDHLIVGRENNKYFSFREKELLSRPDISYITNYKMLNFYNGRIVAEQGKAR